MSNPKRPMTMTQITRKEYAYEKNGVRLAFSLRTDIKTELAAFAEILERAHADVKNDLAK